MGLLFSRFYEKPSTRSTLEKIEQEIQNIEERRLDKIKREKFIVQILSFIPITVLIANICILIYPSGSTWQDKLSLSLPILIFNLVIWIPKKVVQWYSHWSLDNDSQRLRKLQKEKKKILELVCETESYKVATELLEKYDPKQLRRRERQVDHSSFPQNTSLSKISTPNPVRSPNQQRQQLQVHPQTLSNDSMLFLNQSVNFQPPPPPPPTPASKTASNPQTNPNVTSTNLHNASITSIAASSVQGRPVRPVLSKDRSFFEKMVDWVVADGPENRFALICRFCYGHNGMSLAEEFETINFRCCYCYNLNTASNKRQVHDQLQPERRERAESASSTKQEEEEKEKTPTSKEDDDDDKEKETETNKEEEASKE